MCPWGAFKKSSCGCVPAMKKLFILLGQIVALFVFGCPLPVCPPLHAQAWALAPASHYQSGQDDVHWMENVRQVTTEPQGNKELRFIGHAKQGFTTMQRVEYLGKIYWAKYVENYRAQARFIEPQAKLLRHLNSLNVSGICKAAHFLEMENGRKMILFENLPPGRTLTEKVVKEKKIPEAEAVDIILKTATGLQRLHELGVYHWDIKPSNVWVADNGEVILFDFDISFASHDEFYRRKLYRGMFTNAYASQARFEADKGTISQSHDFPSFADEVYALGRTLLTALSLRTARSSWGPPADDSNTHLEMLEKGRRISPELRTILHKAIANGRSEYKTVSAFIQDLLIYQSKNLRRVVREPRSHAFTGKISTVAIAAGQHIKVLASIEEQLKKLGIFHGPRQNQSFVIPRDHGGEVRAIFVGGHLGVCVKSVVSSLVLATSSDNLNPIETEIFLPLDLLFLTSSADETEHARLKEAFVRGEKLQFDDLGHLTYTEYFDRKAANYRIYLDGVLLFEKINNSRVPRSSVIRWFSTHQAMMSHIVAEEAHGRRARTLANPRAQLDGVSTVGASP